MKYESEPSSGKSESKVTHKSKHKRKDSGRSGQKCSEKKQVLLKSESISSSEEDIVRSKYESKVIHKSEERLRKSSRKCSEQIAPKEVQAKSESESSVSSSEEEMEEVDESETAEKYSSKQEIDSDHGEVRKSDNISTKTQRRVKKAKKHSEPEHGNAKREQKAQMKQQARHEAKIESDVRLKGSHTSTCKEQIAPKEVQSKSESEYSVSSSEEEMEEVGESETPEEYSSEQEQDSDNEEVSEDPKTSESEVTKETKGFVCPATEKQKKVINQQYIQTSDRGDRRKSGAQKRNSRKKQRAESEIRCNVPDEIVTSSSHYGGKVSQTVEKTNPSKQIQGKEDERRETITYKFKQRAQITEEFSDEEVREKPATKSAKRKEHKKLKAKEKSSTNTGKERNEDEKVARIKIIKTEYHLKTKEKVSLSPDAHVKEQKEKDKRKVHKQANETNEGTDLKADSRPELATRRKAKNTLPSDVTEEDSEGEEEWYSAESNEEENRDTEQNVSVEEEETEPSDDGITSSEEEVSEEHKPYTKEKVKETKRKVTRKEMEKRVKLNVPHLPGDNDPGERSEDQGEHIIKPKKRSRRRHRESSPIARGSSSPSTSQEEQQVQKRKSKRESDRERRKMVVKKKEKREKISSSSAKIDSHTGTCKEQIAPKVVQSKSESEYSASSSEEETVEVDESETAEEYSSEQEQDSDHGEVSEDPAEQTREGEYPSDSETKVKTKKTKGFLCPGNERQKYESIDQQSFQMESDKWNRYKRCAERDAQKHKSRKKQRAEGEISCSVQDEIAVSSSHYRGKAGKSQIAEKTNPLKQIQGKEDERRKAKTQTKAKKNNRRAIFR